jgi:hypothetical protein
MSLRLTFDGLHRTRASMGQRMPKLWATGRCSSFPNQTRTGLPICCHPRLSYPMPAAQPNFVFIPADDFDSAEMSRLSETPLLPNAAALLVEDMVIVHNLTAGDADRRARLHRTTRPQRGTR